MYFRPLKDGRKTFELRRNDRNFVAGDFVHVREYVPHANEFTGDTVDFRITYVLNAGADVPGLAWGWAVLAIERVESAKDTPAPPLPQGGQPLLGYTVDADVIETTPVMMIFEDARGERHTIQGKGYRPEITAGTQGRLIMKAGGWRFLKKGELDPDCTHSFDPDTYTCRYCKGDMKFA